MCALQGALAEDNARFVLLAIVLLVYMLAGAALFEFLESDLEVQQSADYWKVYNEFRDNYLSPNDSQALQHLDGLLYAWGNATATGVVNKRRRWDFSGAFHFVGTIVSTIGYGSTTPQTLLGKLAVVLYGFFGCSGGILFFNLFLERIITFLAWVLRSLHLRRLKRRLRQTTLASSRRMARPRDGKSLPDILDDDEDEDVGLEHWKPSVYWVMLYLTLASCTVACLAASLYSPMERWTYFEALYFSFVSFATIGFGDYVSLQRPYYPYLHLYRCANFMFLVIGCCCIYSLLNVTSIVIKQGLNCIIRKLNFQSRLMAPHLPRKRSSVSAIYHARRFPTKLMSRDSIRPGEMDYNGVSNGFDKSDVDGYDSPKLNCNAEMGHDDPRRMSGGELISMKGFLSGSNLAHLQKQLCEMARDVPPIPLPTFQPPTIVHHTRSFNAGSAALGPLAIACEKLEER